MNFVFLGPTTSTQYNSILTQFRKICPKIKIKTKEELLILGSPIGELCRKELLDEKIKELEKISDVIDKLDAHYGFYLLKNCFSMPKLLYFLRTSPCFLQNGFLERYDKLLRNSLCKVTNVKMDDNQFLQAVLPAAIGGLGVSSARLLALPAFLAGSSNSNSNSQTSNSNYSFQTQTQTVDVYILKHQTQTQTLPVFV